MAKKLNRLRMYARRSEERQPLTQEEIFICEAHVLLGYPKTFALKHGYLLDVKPVSLPALASRFFNQPHIKSYVSYLEGEKNLVWYNNSNV